MIDTLSIPNAELFPLLRSATQTRIVHAFYATLSSEELEAMIEDVIEVADAPEKRFADGAGIKRMWMEFRDAWFMSHQEQVQREVEEATR